MPPALKGAAAGSGMNGFFSCGSHGITQCGIKQAGSLAAPFRGPDRKPGPARRVESEFHDASTVIFLGCSSTTFGKETVSTPSLWVAFIPSVFILNGMLSDLVKYL